MLLYLRRGHGGTQNLNFERGRCSLQCLKNVENPRFRVFCFWALLDCDLFIRSQVDGDDFHHKLVSTDTVIVNLLALFNLSIKLFIIYMLGNLHH